MSTSSYDAFVGSISRIVPPQRIHLDELSRLAFGTDASFYRLIPKVAVHAESLEEVALVLREAAARTLPVTFRAAGTSLSGQAVTDSILVMLGRSWRGMQVLDGGARIRLQPGVVGSAANAALAPYGRKIGPDPASINAAMIGGIAANNASGMCCGIAQNSYRTLASMKVLLADGTLLDTGDAGSKAEFRRTNGMMLDALSALSKRVREDEELAGRIRRKYGMKNTTGYSLNALVDFDDPFDILQHLMIGSEGTLGFIAEITYATVPEHRHKSTALLFFPDIRTACAAVPALKRCRVDAVELMDRAALASVEDKPGMPGVLKTPWTGGRGSPGGNARRLRRGVEGEHPGDRHRPGRLPDGHPAHVHRRPGRILAPLGHPEGALPFRRCAAKAGHHRHHRGRRVSSGPSR